MFDKNKKLILTPGGKKRTIEALELVLKYVKEDTDRDTILYYFHDAGTQLMNVFGFMEVNKKYRVK